MKHRIAQVFTLSISGKHFQFQAQLCPEVVTNVANNLLFGCCCKTRYRNRPFQLFFFLQLANEITDIQVVHTEIVPPCREAVGLIYHKANNMASHQQTLNGLATQHFWSNIEQIGCSVSHLFDSSCPFDRV